MNDRLAGFPSRNDVNLPGSKAQVLVCRAVSAVALVCLIGLPASTAAELERDQEERGFYIGLTGYRDRVSNLEFDLATSTVGAGGVDLRFERSAEFRYDIGWLIPEKKGGVGISYYEYKESRGTEESVAPAVTLLPTSFLDIPVARSSLEGEAKVLARAVDIAYSRDFKLTDNFRATWVLGLRYSRYEHRLEVPYIGSSVDLAIEEVESVGIGPRVGAGFQYDFTPRWGLGGSLGVATLFGDTDGANVSFRAIGTAGESLTFSEVHNLRQTFTQIDLDMYVSYLIWRTLGVRVGYRYAHWYDARARHLFGADDIFETDQVTFDGPYLRVGYLF